MFRGVRDEKDSSGCAIVGMIDESRRRFSGEMVVRAIAAMHERSNGLGGGFAAYGIYPENADQYALHVMFDSTRAHEVTRSRIERQWSIAREEPIPTRHVDGVRPPAGLRRFFVDLRPAAHAAEPEKTEEDLLVETVMAVNLEIDGAYVFSSGKNMGVFKGVGYPEDIGRFFRLEEYAGHTWLSHGRFPTNTPGWWGGAHPVGLLDWAVVHNGEISSYGINKRYLENFGYRCSLHTDTEVIAYLFDLLMRRHLLPLEVACLAMASPFWSRIERLEGEARRLAAAVRTVYASALLNGPFSVVVGHRGGMIGLNDRTKLRPMAVARRDAVLYLASEEAAIREICRTPDRVWHAEGGVPIVGQVRETHVEAMAGPA